MNSCKKDETNMIPGQSDDTRLNFRTSFLNDPPSVVSDRLAFRDMDHFKAAYFELDTLMADIEIYDSLIQANDQINSVYYRLLNDTYTDFSQAYKPFLTDPIMQTLVNQYFEFQIGDYVYVYMNNEELLYCESTNTRAISDIRSINKGVKVNISSIPDDVILIPDFEIEEGINPCECSVKITKVDCDHVKISGYCRASYFWSGDGDVHVLYTNSIQQPSSNEFINNLSEYSHHWSVNGAFEYIIPIQPNPFTTYSYIHVMADPDCPMSSGYNTYAWWEITEEYCDNKDHDTGFLDEYSANKNELMVCHLSKYTSVFGIEYERAIVKSKTKINGEYERSKAKLAVSIDVSRREFLWCSPWQNDDDNDSCTSCYEREAKTNNFNLFNAYDASYCDGDVTAEFKKIKSGITLTKSLSLDFENCCTEF